MGQKCVFPKVILDHLGFLIKRNERNWSLLQAILATRKSQNALEMGCFGTQNQSKMGQKLVTKVFPQTSSHTIWGASTIEMHCEPIASHLGLSGVT